MAKKYKTVFQYSFGVGRDFLIKESIDNKKMFYLSIDEKFEDEEIYSRKLTIESAKEFFIKTIPEYWQEWNGKTGTVKFKKSEIFDRYFGE